MVKRRRIWGPGWVWGWIFAVFGSACDGESITPRRGILEAEEQIAFGNVQVGIEAPYAFEVRNAGDAVFRVTGIETTESWCTPAYELKLDGACDVATLAERSFGLGPNQTQVMQLSFRPFVPADTDFETRFRLLTDLRTESGQPVTFTVRVSGRGVVSGIEVVPNPVDFGRVLVGAERLLSVQLTNRLESSVDLRTPLDARGQPEIANPGGLGRFEIIQPEPDSARGGSLLPEGTLLEANESISVTLRYVPDAAQTDRDDMGRWSLSNCESSLCRIDVTLLGRGTNAAIECTPAVLDFERVNPGATSTLSMQCENIATQSVIVLGWNLEPSSSDAFSVEPYQGQVSSLEPGDSFSVDVQFSPTESNLNRQPTGSLIVRGRNPIANRELDETRVALQGEAGGPNIEVLPLSLSFGRVAVNTESKKRFLIQNTGYNDLTITDIEPDTAGVGSFEVSRQSFILPRGEAEVIEVTFTPNQEGVVSSSVRVSSDDRDTPSIEVALTGQGVDLPPCNYVLRPDAVRFGIVEVLRTTAQSIRIENVGQNDCLINDLEIGLGSASDFSLPNGAQTDLTLAPGAVETVWVSYTPGNEGEHTGDLTFYISSPDRSSPTVDLHGVGASSALLVSPNELDFGQVGVGCSTRDHEVTIYNTGNVQTSIERIELPPGVTSEYSLTNLPPGIPGPPGVAVSPGGSTSFAVRYEANDLGQDTGIFHVYEVGRSDPYVIPLFAEGAANPVNVDRFEQLETPEVDILFVIDNSCSMSEEQASLTANFQSFIQFADSQVLDYRIGVVSTDVDRCPNPVPSTRPMTLDQGQCGFLADGTGDGRQQNPDWRLISPDEQPSPALAFSAIGTQGIEGTGFERGLEAAYRALSSTMLTGWNAGFVRPDAYLALVFISDEDDSSGRSIDFFANYFLSIKGFRNTNLFSASAIVGDVPSGCGDVADPGTRYIDIARRTGGIFESICTADWATALENLGLSVFGYKSRFFLSNRPATGSITVEVDGVEVPSTAPNGPQRWTYDSAGNSLQFSPLAIPEPGSEITISYRPECL